MRHRFERKKIRTPMHRLWLLTVFLAAVSVLAGGVFAAYVSRSYVKGVAATPKQGISLSSDYLSVVSKNADPGTYPDKKIVLAEKSGADDTDYSFTFSIMNTANGAASTKRIQYFLHVSGLPVGASVWYNETDITTDAISGSGYKAPVMNAYTSVTHTYTVTIPQSAMTSAANITVTAVPDKDSDTSGFILAGKLQPSIIGTVAAFSYSGSLRETGNVADYAAFNYQISVSNAEGDRKMKLTWDQTKIEIDPLFLKQFTEAQNPGSLELTMNDTNSSYLIQFYRLPGAQIGDWADLNIQFGPAE